MLHFDDYVTALKLLERDTKLHDEQTAYNIARELSVIYLKDAFSVPQKGVIERLGSMINYINKTIPDNSELLVFIIEDMIEKMKNPD